MLGFKISTTDYESTRCHFFLCVVPSKILKWPSQSVNFISLVTSCAGLQGEEQQTAHLMSTWASHIAASMLTGRSTLPDQSVQLTLAMKTMLESSESGPKVHYMCELLPLILDVVSQRRFLSILPAIAHHYKSFGQMTVFSNYIRLEQ